MTTIVVLFSAKSVHMQTRISKYWFTFQVTVSGVSPILLSMILKDFLKLVQIRTATETENFR